MHRALLVSFTLLLGCPAPAPPAALGPCTQLGSKCKTPSGPLGVCDSIPCAAGTAGLCFKCMPQH